MRPLDGLVVLDLTRLLPGAAATMLLANFGAEVIKVEEPGAGDYARSMPPLADGEGAVFRATNRGKKSVVLNLKSAAGKQDFLRLAEGADVLIEGFRPGAMQRLGLDYDTLHARNPRLIYASLTGYGQHGPYSSVAGHDINYIALGGLLGLTGDKAPAIPAAQIADLAGGSMQAVIGILLALAAREKTGRGQQVDVAMLDGVVWLMALPMAVYAATGELPRRGEARLTGRYACYRTYEAADGRWLAVGALEPKFWRTLCERLGRPELAEAQYAEGARRVELIDTVTRLFRTRPAGVWLELLKDVDACVSLVRTLDEVARPEVIPKLSETPGEVGGEPPRLGEHTVAIVGKLRSEEA